MSDKTSISTINFRWACGCLAACLVGTLSFKWAESPQIVNIISVALSLASLILAVIAIIQALVSNDGMLRSLSDINNAASNILSVSRDLGSATAVFSSHVDRIGSMPNQLTAINDQVIEICSKIDADRYTTNQPTESANPAHKETKGTLPLRKLTYGITLSLYAIKLSSKNGKKFDIHEIIGKDTDDYCAGIIAGLRASEILDIDFDDQFFSVKSQKGIDEDAIDSLVFNALKDEKAPSMFADYIKKIDAYFEDTPSTPPAA